MEQRPDSSQLSSEPPKPRLKERFHEAIRTRGYSQRTAKSYWFWIRWFIRHHGRRHPAELGAAEVEAFLSWLATERNVAAAPPNPGPPALPFLFQQGLG